MTSSINQVKDVVRMRTYHRHDFDLDLVGSRLHEIEPAQELLQAPFIVSLNAGLCALKRLPIETMSMVLPQLISNLSSIYIKSREKLILWERDCWIIKWYQGTAGKGYEAFCVPV